MGKEQHKGSDLKTFVLKVDMHCECNGCAKKINEGVKDISLAEGVEMVELVMERGEVKVVGRVDAEKLCHRLHEVTNKYVKIDIRSNIYGGVNDMSQPLGDLFGQAHADSSVIETPKSSNGWQNSLGGSYVTPSAPPLPEIWSHTVPSERCAYRWSASYGTRGLWTSSDITDTLAMYEL